MKKYDDGISYVAQKLGDKGVADLERLATAFFLTNVAADRPTVESRAEKLTTLKPHIDRDQAVAAILEADKIVAEAAPIIERLGQ